MRATIKIVLNSQSADAESFSDLVNDFIQNMNQQRLLFGLKYKDLNISISSADEKEDLMEDK